jgi:hypothetical protein
MKTLALAVVAVTGLGGATSAQADLWFDGPAGFSVPLVAAPYDGRPHGGGPYFVAGFGDDHHVDQSRYWGGPYWTTCRGLYPPFQTYRIPPASCRPFAVKVAGRQHQRVIRARLK